MARKFFECSQLLWNRATEWFPKHYLERVFQDLTQYPLNDGENRLCGAWTGCAVNVAVDHRPVQTQVHRDVQGFINGMSCLCPFGMFSAGGMVLWELRAVVKLNRGHLFFFTDHLINHSNEKAWGPRHSVVAFMDQRTWLWMQREHGFKDARLKPTRSMQKRFRNSDRTERDSKMKKRKKISRLA